MNYTDAYMLLDRVCNSQNKWHSKTLKNRAKKLLHHGHITKHFVSVFDLCTADAIFDKIVSNFKE